jgi:hypothetical protein
MITSPACAVRFRYRHGLDLDQYRASRDNSAIPFHYTPIGFKPLQGLSNVTARQLQFTGKPVNLACRHP